MDYIPFLEKNFQPIGDFEGFTPFEIYNLLYSPYDEDLSPLRMNLNLTSDEFFEMKFYADLVQYLTMLKGLQPLKLTQKGNLPRKFCRDLYDLGVKDEDIPTLRGHPISRELDSLYIHVVNLLTRDLGMVKKRTGKLSLTQKGEKQLEKGNHPKLFRELFQLYTRKFNWGYTDGYPDSWIIQGGFAFSVFLVQRHGDKPRTTVYYAERFLKAFPQALEDFVDSTYVTLEENFTLAYSLRTFERFLKRFGFVETTGDENPLQVQMVKKKQLIDAAFDWNNF